MKYDIFGNCHTLWTGFQWFPTHFQIWKWLKSAKMHLKNHFILRYLNNHFHCIFTLLSGIEEGKMLKKGKTGLVVRRRSFYSRKKSCNLIKLACNLENISCVLKKQLFCSFQTSDFHWRRSTGDKNVTFSILDTFEIPLKR